MCEVDVKIIKRTQETLGKLIKKPVLTEKLLSRPPFRFLHDICTSVSKQLDLYCIILKEELEADNVKDKDKKLAFLQKLVDFLSVVHERTIPVRIMSIVAGKEAEKTNEMLFLLAEAVNKRDPTNPVNIEKCGSARENHLFQDSGSRDGSQCGLQTPEKSQEEIVAPSLQNSEASVFQPRHHRPASAKGQRVKRDGSRLTSFCFYVF
ncbi:unnamed protein product [Schistosoma margrebowiei]|uniref:TRAF3-interacting protein 1 n=1 Tax=Schistosoma margrebowiei TaxID=48269 RepID=A0A183LJS7_9TREM|nr:unnamed protein product [Schistosoma margrebowiei]